MIGAVDIETYQLNKDKNKYEMILDSTKFICGGLVLENGKKEVFKDKRELWHRIIELGISHRKQEKCLSLYGHNHAYDFYGYADLKDKNLKIYCQDPFIASYTINDKEVIKFLDTLAIFRMSLARLGNLINIPKLDGPKSIPINVFNKPDLTNVIPYMLRDCEICIESIKFLKNKLRNEDVYPRRLMTINQIAINYVFKELICQNPMPKDLVNFYGKPRIHPLKNIKEIRASYKGGRNECFKTGSFENVTYIDVNSLYPHALTKIPIPKPKSERLIKRPLEITNIPYLLEKEGLSKVMIKNVKCQYGLLPIRTNAGSYYPKIGKVMIGTYTHIELREAIKNGYEILGIEESVVFDCMDYNPFENIIKKLYQKRLNSDFDKWLYKSIMNSSIGKLGQYKANQELFIDSVEKAEEYLQRNCKIIQGIDLEYLYQRDLPEFKPKPYFCPIIPSFVNAWSRVHMYNLYKKIPLKDLIYTDTDSIIFKGDHLEKFEIGKELGKLKIEHQDKPLLLYGRKTYAIGEEIKIGGFNSKNITKKDFIEGYIECKKQITPKTASKFEDIGKFEIRKRNLIQQKLDHDNILKKYESLKLYVDIDIDNINYFLENVSKDLYI